MAGVDAERIGQVLGGERADLRVGRCGERGGRSGQQHEQRQRKHAREAGVQQA